MKLISNINHPLLKLLGILLYIYIDIYLSTVKKLPNPNKAKLIS